MVVFAEVIEHLYTAPELVIGFLSHVLVANGSLILQTPNAVSLTKRLKLGIGVNPFEQIRIDRLNPGHYREYTLDELVDILTRSQFSIEKSWRKYYFDVRYAKHEMGTEKPKLSAAQSAMWPIDCFLRRSVKESRFSRGGVGYPTVGRRSFAICDRIVHKHCIRYAIHGFLDATTSFDDAAMIETEVGTAQTRFLIGWPRSTSVYPSTRAAGCHAPVTS